MAQIDRFMIAPINNGQQGDVRPWMLPEDAFEILINVYVWRGRVRKRPGSQVMNPSAPQATQQLYTRLRKYVGTTAPATGDFTVTIPGTKWAVGQMFSVGTTMFTAYQAAGATLSTSVAVPPAVLPATATYDTTNGHLIITGNDNNDLTDVFFYPATPVMGITQYFGNNINNEVTIAFDQQFAYQYTGAYWDAISGPLWTGTDSQFFWACNWRGTGSEDFILFVVNSNPPDGIKYWNGTVWTKMTPQINSTGSVLNSSVMIVVFKNRLICLNTFETTGVTTTQFGSRARFCQSGTPLISADVNAWRQDITGKGAFVDAPTKEEIVSCGFVKDRLIVYFERSTWELVYTANQLYPFIWQRINSELGVQSTFSAIQFDKVVLGIGAVGVHACNGANVERIDQKIPDTVFQISNANEGVYRVCGIRDYFLQVAYWAYPTTIANTYPNELLVYNYINGSWASFEDSVTAFGYYQSQGDLTWATWTWRWEESFAPWDSGQTDVSKRQVLAGNQEGFTFIIDQQFDEGNAQALQITNMVASMTMPEWVDITIINHNLATSINTDHYIQIENAQGVNNVNGKIYDINLIDLNTISIHEPRFTGVYTGGGTVERVSNIQILTKQYNFYVDKGRNAYVSKVDFYVDATTNGQVTVDTYIGDSNYPIGTNAVAGTIMGTAGILDTSPYPLIPLEAEQQSLWHPIYPQADGEFVQLEIYMTAAQMTNPLIAFSYFEMHAMTFYTTPTASRLQ